MEVFDSLPVSAVVDKKYLALHGGIGPDLKKVDTINKFDRF
jgi:serine/threonine-protein phosphatase 2B catalytic subunit